MYWVYISHSFIKLCNDLLYFIQINTLTYIVKYLLLFANDVIVSKELSRKIKSYTIKIDSRIYKL